MRQAVLFGLTLILSSLTTAQDTRTDEHYEVKNIRHNVITIPYQGRTLVGKCAFTIMHDRQSSKETFVRGCLTEPNGKYGGSIWKDCERADSTDCASLTEDSGSFIFSVHLNDTHISAWAEVVWTNDPSLLQKGKLIPN